MNKDIRKEEIDLLYEDDLFPVLEKISLNSDFVSGKIFCMVCKDILTEENFYCLFKDVNIKFVCNKKSCVESFNLDHV